LCFGSIWMYLGGIWLVLGGLGRYWVVFGWSWVVLGRISIIGSTSCLNVNVLPFQFWLASVVVLVLVWIGIVWVVLGCSGLDWVELGGILGGIEQCWVVPGCIWVASGWHWVLLGGLWVVFGGVWACSSAQSSVVFWVVLGDIGWCGRSRPLVAWLSRPKSVILAQILRANHGDGAHTNKTK
jgi:hypothetical protein